MKIKLLLLLTILMVNYIHSYSHGVIDSTKTKGNKPISYKNLSLKYQAGRVLQTNSFVKGENKAGKPIDYYHSWSLNYSRQTSGEKEWEHIHNFPHFGFGFYTANFFNDEELGYPNALYGFIGLPFKRYDKGEFGYKLGFGLTYNWKPYDGYNNPFNVAIGSYRTVYIDANLYYNYHLGKRWDLAGGWGFTHFSNGGTRKPNSGLNLLSPYIELKYNFKDRPTLIRKIVNPYQKHKELSMNIAFSGRQMNPRDDVDERFNEVVYGVINISAAYLYQPAWKNKYGAGFDLTYDESINAELRFNNEDEVEIVPPAKFGEKMMLGIYGTYEFTIDRLSIASYLGYILLRKEYDGMSPNLYQKFGIKYHFKNDMYVGVLVRAHNFSVAEFIEWNIGYRIKWN